MRLALLGLLVSGCGLIAEADDWPAPADASTGRADAGTGGEAGVESAYAKAVLADEPLAYFRLGEGVGRVEAINLVDDAHPGVYDETVKLGVPGAISGDPDTAAQFGDILGFSGRAPFTMEAWVKPNAGEKMIVAGKLSFDGSIHLGWCLLVSPIAADGLGVQAFRFPGNIYAGGGELQADVYSHVAVTFGMHLNVYLNGQLLSSTEDPFEVSDHEQPFSIARGPGWAGYQGAIDEVAVYDQTLSEDSLRAHYQLGKGL